MTEVLIYLTNFGPRCLRRDDRAALAYREGER